MASPHSDLLAKMTARMDRDIERLIGGTTSTATPDEGFTLGKFNEAVRKLRQSPDDETLSARSRFVTPTWAAPLFPSVPGTFGGVALMRSDVVGDPVEDWSEVRSPARARRRRKRHPQNIKTVFVPNGKMYRIGAAIYGHTLDIARLEDQVRRA